MTTLGFVGLGKMGLPMSARLEAAGYKLYVFDINPAVVERVCARGAIACNSPTEVASQVDLVLISLPTPAAVSNVVVGSDGIAHGKTVRCLVDLSTTGPAMARQIGETLKARGIGAIDAPVSGGVGGATAGTLAIMTSGTPEMLDRAAPVLKNLGRVINVGSEFGQGQMMKLVNNMISGSALAITAEAMALGAKAGLDAEVMIEVLNAGSGRNTATVDKFPKSVLTGGFDYGFATALMHKDAALFMQEAKAMGLRLPVAEAVVARWRETLDFIGDQDFTTIAKMVEQQSNVALRSKAKRTP